MATITVHRGLNIEENREPLIEITQAWTKSVFGIAVAVVVVVWKKLFYKKYF